MEIPVIGEVNLGKMGRILFLLFLMLYIILPFDIIPEAIFGPVGLLDDIVAGIMLWNTLKQS